MRLRITVILTATIGGLTAVTVGTAKPTSGRPDAAEYHSIAFMARVNRSERRLDKLRRLRR
jgi:hypothetical protein